MKSITHMKKETLTVCIAMGLVAGGMLSASAQRPQDHRANQPAIGQQEQTRMSQDVAVRPTVRASQLLEKKVHGPDGQPLGVVQEIILSQDSRSVEHIKVSLNDGDRVALSLDEFFPKGDHDDAVRVQASLQELQQRQMQNPERDQARDGREPDKQAARRLSNLMGLEVQGSDGKDVGRINDLIIDTQSGHIKTAAVETSGFLGLGTRLTSMEWPQVNVDDDGDAASIRMKERRLYERAYKPNAYWDRYAYESVKGPRPKLGLHDAVPRQHTSDM